MDNINETSTVGTMLPQVGLNGKESKGVISAKNMIAKMASTSHNPVSYELTEAMLDYMNNNDVFMNEKTYNLLISEAEDLVQSMNLNTSVSAQFMADVSKKSALKVKLKAATENLKNNQDNMSEDDIKETKKNILDWSMELEKQSERIQKEIDSLPEDNAKIYKKCEKAANRFTNAMYKKNNKNIAKLVIKDSNIENNIDKQLHDVFDESVNTTDYRINIDNVHTEAVLDVVSFLDVMFFVVSGILAIFITASLCYMGIKEKIKSKKMQTVVTNTLKNIDKYFKEKDKKNYISLYECTFKQLSLLPTANNDDLDASTKEAIKSAIRQGYLGLLAYVDKDNRGVIAAGYTKDKVYYKLLNKKYELYFSFYKAQINWDCFGFVSEESSIYLNKIAKDIYNEDHINVYEEGGNTDMLTEKDLSIFYENNDEDQNKENKKEDKPKTVSPEVKRLDELRGKVADLEKEVKKNKDLYAVTKEAVYEKKIKGLTAKLEKAKEELKKGEEKAKREEERIAKESVMFEKADLDPEMKPIVDKLNSKGYHVKYASPGHENLRKKEDRDRNGTYYNKLYSDARIMFDDKYKFPDLPKFWHWRDVDGCSYLDVTPVNYNPDKDGSPNQAFTKWKERYMETLSVFVDELDSINSDSKDKDEIKESTEAFNSMIDDMYADFILTSNEVTESAPIYNANDNLLSELNRLLK